MIRRILYYANDSMVLLEWKKQQLLGRIEFENTKDGFESFKKTVQSLPKSFTQMLINVQEEDFQQEEIPHVRGSARKALEKRLIDRFYRDEKYVCITPQGRSKAGRKDDKVLLSSLNPDDNFQKWVELINSLNIPIAGIWSAPLLTQAIIKTVAKKSYDYILISKDRPGHYRQTLFSSGNLILSRKIVVEKNISSEYQLNALSNAIDQLYNFAKNKRIIDFNKKVVVVCHVGDDCFNKMVKNPISDEVDYINLELPEAIKNQKKISKKFEAMEIFYSFICSKKMLESPHYQEENKSIAYQKFKLNKQLFKIMLSSTLVFLSLSGIMLINAEILKDETIIVERKHEKVRTEYTEKFLPIEEKLNATDRIRQFINKAMDNKESAKQFPIDLFPDLGEIMEKEKYKGINLSSIQWKRYSGNDYESINQYFKKDDPKEHPMEPHEEQNLASEFSDEHMTVDPIEEDVASNIFVTIKGAIDLNRLDYDSTVSLMQSFGVSLQDMRGIAGMHMVSAPVDIRKSSRFSDFNQTVKSDAANKKSNDFEFLLKFDGKLLKSPQRY